MSNIVKASFVVEVPRKQNTDEAGGSSIREFPSGREMNVAGALREQGVADAIKAARAAMNGVPPEDEHPMTAAEKEEAEKRAKLIREREAEAEKIIADAEAEAAAIREEADKLLAEAEAEVVQIRESAQADGFQAGLTQGAEQAREEAMNAVRESLNELEYFIEAVSMERMQTYKEQEEDLVRLSFEIAKKIMRQQIKVDKASIPYMIADVVKENEDAVQIYVSEYNQTLFTRIDRQTREKLKELLPGIKVMVLPNDGKEEFIQIETENGMVDVTVENQLELLKQAIGAAEQ